MLKQAKKRRIIEILAGIFAIVLAGILFARLFYNSSQEKVLNTLKEISAQSVEVMLKEIDGGKDVLSNLAMLLGQEEEPDLEGMLERLVEVDHSNVFKRMGIVTPDGQAHTTDKEAMDLKERSFFKESMSGNVYMSEVMEDKTDGNRICVFSAPIDFENGERYVLFAALSIENFQESLSVSSFEGEGFSYVVRKDGSVVAGSQHENALGEFENVLEGMVKVNSRNTNASEDMEKHMAAKESGSVIFKNGTSYYIYYEPLDIHGWYLLTVAPVDVVQLSVNGTLMWMYAFIIGASLVIILMALHLVRVRSQSQKVVEQIAFRDETTGGSTYAKFKLDVKQAILSAEKSNYAVVYLNVHKFQYINELFGYDEGDRALKFIWSCIQEELLNGELFARIQADYFCMFLKDDGREILKKRIEALIRKIGGCTDFEGKHYEIKMSAGVYELEEEVVEIETMIDRANMALNSGDRNLLGSCTFFDGAIREERIRIKEMEDGFLHAIENKEFTVYYQPKFNLKEKRFEGAEALVRWQHPVKGLISPGEFIPVFEKNGMIVKLDEYVFEEVCKKVREWLDKGYEVEPISVNASRLHLYQKDFIERYLRIVEQYHVPVKLIQMELTETVMLSDEELLKKIVEDFRKQGIWVLMDDFGAGYSSLNTLKSIPVDVLKMDKRIVDDYEHNEKGEPIITSIISLAKQLKIHVTAEGVETKEQYDFLEKVNCDFIQGYYCARPMPVKEYEKSCLANAQTAQPRPQSEQPQ